MFPSTSSITHLSSTSCHNLSPYITDHVPGDIFQYQNPLAIPSLPTNPAISESLADLLASSNIAAMNSKQVMDVSNAYPCNPFHPIPCKRPVKKDRHSKISTAQGLRDRRVRLSIGIARRFFDLQDSLGFDKASKTLEWLLTKSRKSIKELSENGAAKSGSSTSTCEVVSENGYREGMPLKIESLDAVSSGKKMRRLQKAAAKVVLAKESRAKARARARERTRVKMCTRRAHEPTKCPDPSSHILNRLACEASDSYGSHNMTSSSSLKVVSHEVKRPSPQSILANQVPQRGVVEESIVITRKLKPTAIMSRQKNLVISKEVNCNPASCGSSKYYLPNLPPNRDTSSSTIAHSGLFNVNLSAGLQIYGKIWETDYNQYHE